MATNPKLLTATLWPRLKELARRPGRMLAAAPYFSQGGAKRLPLKKGDVLVTRFDDVTIKTGMTDPREILKLINKGVAVHAVGNLHAKVYVTGSVVIVGSANVSSFSENYLVEAALETRDAGTVRACRQWIESLTGDIVEPAFAEAKVSLYRPPRVAGIKGHVRRRSGGAVTLHQTGLWIMRLHSEEWDDAANEADRKARAEGAKRLTDSSLFRQDTFRLVGRRTIGSLRIGQRVVQLLDTGSKPVQVFAPGRVVAIRRYSKGTARCAIVSLEVRKGTKTRNLRDLVKQLGKAAEVLRRTKDRRFLGDRDLVYRLARLWKYG